MLNDRQLYSVKQTNQLFFLKYAHFESVCVSEWVCVCVSEWASERAEMCVNYLHLFVPTNNETVNLVLLQNHVYYCWKIIIFFFFKK